MIKEEGKYIIKQKVKDFEKDKSVITKKGFGETDTRTNYIDVLFEALGWDMKNYYDVKREQAQKDNSFTKKVDYAFKINGKIKFFVEAKESSVDLVNDKDAIYQAKRYAYSTNGKAPIVILTDFEEFRVFNVLKAPLYDNTDRELLKKYCMTFTDYVNKWDLLWNTFSKEAVENGSINLLRGKIDKNTKLMDDDFLEQIIEWRKILAENIYLRNKELSVEELNESVQRILDRLVFIRNLEDREIQTEYTLLEQTLKIDNIYNHLIPIFNNLDKVYNGLLFKKHFSENLKIDDIIIKKVIKAMSYPVSPFQFDVIEPEILGRIYEKFLGSKIRIGKYNKPEIEEKIEVRKASGVYYTPENIVNYIVENTVGKIIDGLNPKEIKNIKILDPSCGSGSFLLGAYSYIILYLEKWYKSHKSNKTYKDDYYISKHGELKVNLKKRGEILKNNIFGVDIDKEATEVAIMSLYLKMLDNGFEKGQLLLFFGKGKVLPDMVDNIKCGNSLIDLDIDSDKTIKLSKKERKTINPFDWKTEFKDIFKNKGFDIVIGNPPYVRPHNIDNISKKYYWKHYKSFKAKSDLYAIFIERVIDLLKDNGLLGYIVSSTWLGLESFSELRRILLGNQILELFYPKSKIFKCATVETTILLLEKSISINNKIKIKDFDEFRTINVIEQNIFSKTHNKNFDLSYRKNDISNFSFNSDNFTKLSSLVNFAYGFKTADDKKFLSKIKVSKEYKPFLRRSDFSRYLTLFNNEYVWYRPDLMRRNKITARPGEPKRFETPKIIVADISRKIVAQLDLENFYIKDALILLNKENSSYSLKYFLGILNSKLLSYIYTKSFLGLSVAKNAILEIPIPIINFRNESKKQSHDKIVQFVEQMLEAKIQFHLAKSDNDEIYFKRECKSIDQQIDFEIFKLYGLSKDEINIFNNN